MDVVIDVNGRVERVDLITPSRYPRLAEAAAVFAKREFRYKPAAVDGNPVPSKVPVTTTFCLDGCSPQSECQPRAPVFAHERYNPKDFAGQETRWTLINSDGEIADALILTQKGWMRFGPALIEQMRAVGKLPPSSENRRPPVCWLPR
jgi:hypothetical protein